jgi:hypothetical protein
MKELTDLLSTALGVSASQAQGGAGLIFKAAREKLGTAEFSKLLTQVPDIDRFIAKAPAAGGLGKLFGGLAGTIGGGNAAILAELVAGFGKLGLTAEHAKSFAPVMMKYLRGHLGADDVERLEKTLRS